MSKQLEDIIKANREEFDDLEPRPGLWNKIEGRLNLAQEEPVQSKKRQAKNFSLGFVLRMAAIIIVAMAVGFILYIQKSAGAKVDYAKINPEYAQQRIRYASMVEAKRTELKALTKSNPELYKEFSAELTKMDSTYNRLNKDLTTSPNQERVLRAMIRNLQIQTEVLNQQLNVIEQYNEFKDQQQNETKSI